MWVTEGFDTKLKSNTALRASVKEVLVGVAAVEGRLRSEWYQSQVKKFSLFK
jgi:hypothetical protein